MIACSIPRVRTTACRLSFLVIAASGLIPDVVAQAPASVPGLRVWLRADQGVETSLADPTQVTTWRDQSGLNNHGASPYGQYAPRLLADEETGGRYVQFDRYDSLYFTSQLLNTSGGEMFVVGRSTGTSGNYLQLYWGHAPEYAGRGTMRDNFLSSETHSMEVPNDGDTRDYHLYNVAAAPGRWSAWLDGLVMASTAANLVPSSTGNGAYIGGSLGADFREILLYDRILTDAEREQITAYLRLKYASPKPTNFVASLNAGGGIGLSWAGWLEDSYQLERKGPDDADFVVLATNATSQRAVDNVSSAGAYTYRVRARDRSGNLSDYTTAAVTIGTPSVPFASAGLQMWLRADAGVVRSSAGAIVEWQDLSGAGNHASPIGSEGLSADRVGGRAAVRIYTDLRGCSLKNPLAGKAAGEMIIVLKENDGAREAWMTALGYMEYPGWEGRITDYFGDIETYAGVPNHDFGQPTYYDVALQPSTKRIWLNGVEIATQPLAEADVIRFETGPYAEIRGTDTDFAEIIVFDRVLDDVERQQLHSYLNSRYAAIAVPPAPAELTASLDIKNAVRLSWAPSGSAQVAYKVQRRLEADEVFQTVAPTLTTLSFVDTTAVPGASYVYRVSAVNGLGQESGFSEVSCRCDFAVGTYLPAPPALWLRADRGVRIDSTSGANLVTQWRDFSGNDNHGCSDALPALSDSPVLVAGAMNGKDAVAMKRTNLQFQKPIAAGGTGEVFFVLKRSATGIAGIGSFLGGQHAFGASPNEIYDSAGGIYTAVGRINQDVSQATLYDVELGEASRSFRINGIGIGTFDGRTSSTAYYDPSAQLYGNFGGSVAEVIVYDRALSDTERAELLQYINSRYNVVSPAFTPQSLEASASPAGGIRLDWKPGSVGEQFYDIARKNSGDVDYQVIASTQRGLSFVDTSAAPDTDYTYEVRGRNALGQWSSFTPPVSARATPINLGFPAERLALWLRADAGIKLEASGTRIVEWRDQTRYRRDAFSSTSAAYRPSLSANAINGKPSVIFGPGTMRVSNISSVGPEGELYAVYRQPLNSNQGWFQLDRSWNPSSITYGSLIQDRFLAGDLATTFSSSTWRNGFHIYMSAVNGAVKTIAINGTTQVTAAHTPVLAPVDGGAVVGGREFSAVSGSSNYSSNGELAELLYFSAPLTSAERSGVLNYLQTRYAVISAPVPPTSLKAELNLSGTAIDLTWEYTGSFGVTFQVFRKADDETDFALVYSGPDSAYVDAAILPGRTYTYRIAGRDGLEQLSAPAESTPVTVVSSPPPISNAGLALWFRADRGARTSTESGTTYVAQWLDQSAAGRHTSTALTTSRPKRLATGPNGQAVLEFPQVASVFSFDSPLTGCTEGEYFIVSKWTTSTAGVVQLYPQHRLTANYSTTGWMFDNLLQNSQVSVKTAQDHSKYHLYSAAASPDGVFASVQGVLCTAVRGSPYGPVPAGPVSGFLNGAGQSVAEVVVYDRKLTDAERQAVVDYLHARYALIEPPATPVDVRAELNVTGTEVLVTWQRSVGKQMYYDVERKGANDAEFTFMGRVSDPHFVDTNVSAGGSYSYRVATTNGINDSSAPSEITTIAVTASSSSVPADGLIQWLRADRGLSVSLESTVGQVLRWRDQSGSHHDAEPLDGGGLARKSTSTNNFPAVSMTGPMRFENPIRAPGPSEYFVVYNYSSFGDVLRLHDGHALQRQSTGKPADNLLLASPVKIATAQDTSQFHIYSVSTNSGAWTARVNGFVCAELANPSLTVSTIASQPGGTLLGSGANIAELLVYNRELSAAERQTVLSELQQRYQINTAVAAPTQLTTTMPMLGTSLVLEWKGSNAGQVGYTVERKLAGEDIWETLAQGVTQNSTISGNYFYYDSTVTRGQSYVYRVTATNATGTSSSASTEVATSVPSAVTVIPTQGVSLWLVADRGVTKNSSNLVTDWSDQSGREANARYNGTISSVIIPDAANSYPALRFGYGSSFLFLNTNTGASVAVGGPTAGELFLYHRKNRVSTAGSDNRIWSYFTQFPAIGNITDSWGRTAITTPLPVSFAPTQAVTDYHLYNVASGADWVARINGVEQTRVPSSWANGPATASLGSYGGSGDPCDDIAEVLVYDRILSDAERQQVQQYFFTKYATDLPLQAPTFSLPGGTYREPLTVSLQNPDPTAEIYYTLDGTDPVALVSPRYSDPIAITESIRIKAVAKSGSELSSISSQLYSIGLPPPAVTATSAFAASYYEGHDFTGTSVRRQTVAVGPLPSMFNSAIWSARLAPWLTEEYTFYISAPGKPKLWVGDSLLIDGSNQTGQAELAAKIRLVTGQSYPIRLEYVAKRVGAGSETVQLLWSSVSLEKQTLAYEPLQSGFPYPEFVATPTATPAAGTYVDAVDVSLAVMSLPSAVIYYTVNGETPSLTSVRYQSPIRLAFGATLKAIAYAGGYNPSGVLVAPYAFDNTGPALSTPTFNDGQVPAVIGGDGTFGVTATDTAGVQKVRFELDGEMLAEDVTGVDGFTAPFTLARYSDGAHLLAIRAWDGLNVASAVLTVSFDIEQPSPAAPRITAPRDGEKVNRAAYTVRGNAEKNSVVTVFRGPSVLATATAGNDGAFAVDISLVAGENLLTASARNRNPTPSPLSAAVSISYDNTVPSAACNLRAESKPAGVIRLTWDPPASGVYSGFYLMRSTAPIASDAALDPTAIVGGARLQASSFADSPPSEGRYYYRVFSTYTVGAAETLSSPSNSADAVSDQTAPIATVSVTPGSAATPMSGYRIGQGLASVRLLVSEPLSTPPFLNLSVAGNQALFVDLTPVGPVEYTGLVTIGSQTRSGTVSASFSGYDAAGNRGTDATVSPMVAIDTAGPRVSGVSPVHLTGANTYDVLPAVESIKNDPIVPATTVSRWWRITFDEEPDASTPPVFTATLSNHASSSVGVVVNDAWDADRKTWLIETVLPVDAGLEEAETLTLAFAAQDDLGNVGSVLDAPHVFQVYKGSLPPLPAPASLRGEAHPAGEVEVAWSAVDGAAAYILQAKGPGDSDFVDLQTLPASALKYAYTPVQDGAYTFRVASVRSENGEDAISAWSSLASVVSDRQAPPAPTAVSLQVIAQGVRVEWTAPANLSDVAGYRLYRSDSGISGVQSLAQIGAPIAKTAIVALDAKPVPTQPYYGLVAFDAAGNTSSVATAFTNVSLLPVRQLTIEHLQGSSPVIRWQTPPGAVIDGVKLTIDGEPISVDGVTLLAPTVSSYTDSAYSGGAREYTVSTISGPESRPRSVVLPELLLAVPDSTSVSRGLFGTVNVLVHNISANPITSARVQVRLGSRDHVSQEVFDLGAGEERAVEVVLGGYPDLPAGTAPITLTLSSAPREGEKIVVSRVAAFTIKDGAFIGEVLPSEFNRGGSGKVKLRLTNPSPLPIEFKVASNSGTTASPEARWLVKTVQGETLSTAPILIALGDNVVALPNGQTVVRIPAGGTYTSPQFSIPVPMTAPATVTVGFEIDSIYFALGEPDTQIALPGPRAQLNVLTLEASYAAEILAISPEVSNGQDPIVITGRAKLRGIDPALPSSNAAYEQVVVSLDNSGFIRRNAVLTDANGAFTFTFQPAPGDRGGIYNVWAAHPDFTARPESPATFVLRTVTVQPQVFTHRAPRNYRRDLPIQVITGPGTSLQNVRAVLRGTAPVGVTVSSSPVLSVTPDQTVTLPVSLVGTAPTPQTVDTGYLEFDVVSDAPFGATYSWGSVRVNYEFSTPRPYLQATPGFLQLGLQPGQTTSGSIVIKNTGFAPLDNTVIELVPSGEPLPSWIRLQSGGELGTVDVGAQKTVTIGCVNPVTAIAVDQVFSGYVRVKGRDFNAQDFPFTVTLSPSGVGGVLLKIVDPFYQIVLPDNAVNPALNGIIAASVILEKESSSGVPTASVAKVSDNLGEVRFADLAAGRYLLRISADRHEPYISRITVSPGVTYADTVVLNYNPVTFSWEVVPITFQDRYEIVLTSTYETNVPVPVVVIEPGSISVPKMCAGQVYSGEFKVTNYGLIDAEDVTLPSVASDEYFAFDVLWTFGTKLKAGQTVRVPYRIKCLKPLPGECENGQEPVEPSPPESASSESALAAEVGSAQTLFSAAESGNAATSSSATGCKAYTVCTRISYRYPCPNVGQDQFGSATVCAVYIYGSCPSGGGTYAPIEWQSGSGGSGAGGTFQGTAPGGGSRSTDTSDDCPPPPLNNPYPGGPGPCGSGGGGGGKPEKKECDDNKEDAPPSSKAPCGPFKKLASWVNLATRQYVDAEIDLSVKVIGGTVDVDRVYEFRKWSFQLTDEVYALIESSRAAIVYNGQLYENPAARVSGTSAQQLGTVADVAAGTYLFRGKGPEKITKNADGTLIWIDNNGSERIYDANGRLITRKRDGDLVASFQYAADGLLAAIADRNGTTVLNFTHANGRLTEVLASDGRRAIYTYDSEGRLETATDSLNTKTTYSYDGWWHITQKRIHRDGTSADEDHVVTITHRLLTSSATPSGPVDKVIAYSPRFKEITHGRVEKITQSTGESASFVYKFNQSTRNYYAAVTNASGDLEESVFNQDMILISRTTNGQVDYRMQQDETTRVTTSGDQKLTEEFNDRGNILRRICSDNTLERFDYDTATKRVKRFVARDGLVTEFAHDSAGNLSAKKEAVGTALERTTSYEYYPDSKLVRQTTFPGGRKVGREYDASERLTRTYDPDAPTQETRYEYDTYGNINRITDALGHETNFTYNANGQLLTETNALNEKTVYTYVGANLVELEVGRVGTTAGRITRYTYDSKGRRASERRVDASGNVHVVQTFAYNRDGRLMATTNALGQSTTYEYDVYGHQTVVSVPDADGGVTETQSRYDSAGRVTELIDTASVRTTYEYDAAGRVSKKVEAVGTAVERNCAYRYDATGNLVEQKEWASSEPARVYTSNFTYDGLGRRTAVDGNRPYGVTLAYDAAGLMLSQTDALNRVTSYDYTSDQRVQTVKVDGSIVQTFDYDRVGNRISETDGEGNHRHFVYDALNRLTHESIPLTSAQTLPSDWWTQPAFILRAVSYTPFGEQKSVTRYIGDGTTVTAAVVSYTYDDFGRKLTETDPAGLTRTFTYDAADNVVKVTYPAVASSGELLPTTELYLRSEHNATIVNAFVDRAGAKTQYGYDHALRLTATTNSLHGTTRTTYDALGRAAEVVDAASKTTKYTYDLYGQVIDVTYPDHVAGTHERIERMRYDDHGKIAEKSGAGGYPMVYRYDAVGNLTEMQDANNRVTKWAYTAFNQVATKTYADNTSNVYTYDGAGRMKTRRDGADRITAYAYNAYGLPITIDYANDPDVVFTYSPHGQRLRMVDGSGSTIWSYDAVGRGASETQSRAHRMVRYAYDAQSNRVGMEVTSSDSASNSWQTTYSYDNASRLRSILDPRIPTTNPFMYAYAPAANLVSEITAPTGHNTVKRYDPSGRLTSVVARTSAGATINSFAYTYNAAGQRETETATERSRAFTYDGQRQLTGASASSSNSQLASNDAFTYDGIGNRVTVASQLLNSPAASTAYTTNAVNQYTQLSGALADTPQYDLNGNTTLQGGWAMTYNDENRLIEVSNQTKRSNFVYDGLGRRVERLDYVNGVLTNVGRFVYDGWNVVEELNADFATTRSYTRGMDLSGSFQGAGGIGGLLSFNRAVNGGFESFAYSYDGNGNVTDLTAADGSSAAHYTYGAFGERLQAIGSLADVNPYQFSSKERDVASGLYYYGFRYYDPIRGRWGNRDPIHETGGNNLYAFVQNSPNGRVDTLGLVLVGIDGTGSRGSLRPPNDGHTNSFVYNLIEDFTLVNPDHANRYFHGPAKKLTGSDWQAIHAAALAFICSELKKDPQQPIYLIGHSRGGFVATEIARTLKEKGCSCHGGAAGPINIQFLGLYDAVDRARGGSPNVPDNVKVARHALRNDLSRSYFGHTDRMVEDPELTSYSELTFNTNHGGIGGDPLGGDNPAVPDHRIGRIMVYRPAFSEPDLLTNSQLADSWMRAGATSAGILLK